MILDRDYYRRNQTDALLALKQSLSDKDEVDGYVGINANGSSFIGSAPVTWTATNSITVGNSNTQSGYSNAQSGNSNTQSGYIGLQSGSNNTQSGDSGLQSGSNNTQSGSNGLQSGESANDFGLRAARTHAAGKFAASGDAQIIELVARRDTADATPAELFLDGSSVRCVLQNDSTYSFSILVAARRTDADGESAAYKLEGCIDRNANVASTAMVGTVLKTVLAEDNTAWDVSATADTTNGALAITVTGEAAKTIYWVAYITLVQVTG